MSGSASYDLYAYSHGELDTDDSFGGWVISAQTFDGSGTLISQETADSGSTVSTTWTQKGGTITTPANAATLKIYLYSTAASGWVAFDDVELTASGSSTNLAPDPGFENDTDWSAGTNAAFPATHVRRTYYSPEGGRVHSGDTQHYGYGISNHAYGYLTSDPVAVTAGQDYDLHAWLRGQIDGEDALYGWIVRANFYNSSGGYVGYADGEYSYSASSVSTTWQQKGGTVTAPAGAVNAKTQLFAFNIVGWVTFDDITLTASGSNPTPTPTPTIGWPVMRTSLASGLGCGPRC